MKDNSATPRSSAGRRAASYWFVDGFEEMVLGVVLLLICASGLLFRLYLSNHWMVHYWFAGAGFLLYFIAGRHIVAFLKSRVTYPRTGYVQPPEEVERLGCESLTMLRIEPGPPPNENVTSFRLRTAMVIFFMLAPHIQGQPHWFTPVLMAGTASLLFALNRPSEHPYRWWSALALGLMGLPFLWVDVPAYVRPWLPLLLVGLWLTAQGGGTLVHYLRENPYPRVSEGVPT